MANSAELVISLPDDVKKLQQQMHKLFLKFFLKRYEDEDLQQILMQLVHLMKFEPYPDVAFAAREEHFHNIPNLSISRILVKRAIKTRAFGHFLLWNLRGEQERIAGIR